MFVRLLQLAEQFLEEPLLHSGLLRAMRQPGDVYVIMGSGPVNRVLAPARLYG